MNTNTIFTEESMLMAVTINKEFRAFIEQRLQIYQEGQKAITTVNELNFGALYLAAVLQYRWRQSPPCIKTIAAQAGISLSSGYKYRNTLIAKLEEQIDKENIIVPIYNDVTK
jgi:hypothetical protein